MRESITNFGGNVRFKPRHLYTPANEAEVLAILDRHADGKIRVVGALHAWSPAVATEDVLVNLHHFDQVSIERDTDGNVWAIVGGGCRIKRLLDKLHRLADVTMPSIGLITEQTIAGAISTATHGSGRHSLSHYIAELRVAAYDPDTGKARIYVWNTGPELRAGRCALGAMGIILSVRFRCVPKYEIAETIVACATLDEALAGEEEYPLQQFYMLPHRWRYYAQRRKPLAQFRAQRSLSATLYRAWWFWCIDIGLHVVLTLLVSILRSPALTRFFYRRVLPRLILTDVAVTDHSDRMLVMEHELFQHVEIEIFVPARHVHAAAEFVRIVLEVFDGSPEPLPPDVSTSLARIGMVEELLSHRGTFTHHYAITFRRVLPDDAMIAMSVGGEPYYAISFITYVEPRDAFYALASFLARSMTRLFAARLHWGKYFPLERADVESLYPELPAFREICRRVDPKGVFRNAFVERILFDP